MFQLSISVTRDELCIYISVMASASSMIISTFLVEHFTECLKTSETMIHIATRGTEKKFF